MSATLATTRPEDFGTLSPSAATVMRPTDWIAANAQGLMRAAHGDWFRAAEAFADAVADIEADGQTTASAGSHSPLALVLSNLAQAWYQTGRVMDAIRCQERVVALRIAMTGEGSVAVARSRSDLAALLGSIGRVEEAAVLARRALMAVESSGAPDMALAAVLANAARIAIVAGATRDAEQILRRLHAVEARCGMDSSATDALLERIGAAPITPPAGSPLLVDIDDLFPAPTPSAAPVTRARVLSPTSLAITHELEFVDEIPTPTAAWAPSTSVESVSEDAGMRDEVVADDAEESPVGEYPHLPESEPVPSTHDVRTRTMDAPALSSSGAYALVEATTPVESERVPTGRGQDAQELLLKTDAFFERRMAERRRTARITPAKRALFAFGGLVVGAGLTAILALLF